ncbi:geranylgeranylglycerol-phosphate geranylgeranyltransferase [Halococcus thailandensis]|uniref:Digeranylgeranylglyceryl phosphate synthase n=1 Tax=Halococcus thailandensis JCM 13552 TaxID=1227457 RepID=M0MZ57_9EURY|nr:geranylgeranylglycerol-phosphate geranylgeranyltransferase [Halococcus thailandensis]EMA50144.1 prenyltransferase [Halococcus thailandensis JCM 13552]
MSGERARGLLELTRPVNAVAAGMLTFIGAFVAGGLDASIAVGAAVGATVLATAAGNAMNDYFDREIDRINEPDRPIPRGAVTPRAALWFSVLLFGGAVVLALALPLVAIAIAVVNLVALVAYTELFKGLPGVGNLVVGYLGGSTFLFGAAAVGRITEAVVVLFALAALSTVAREIVKDIEDVAGDRREGLHTLPIAIGERPALWLAIALLAIALLASPLPYLQETFGWPYLAVVAIADLVMAVAAVESFGDPTAGQEHLSYAMFLAGGAFVVGRLAVAV